MFPEWLINVFLVADNVFYSGCNVFKVADQCFFKMADNVF
jgi:hypothetical protein